MKTFSQHILFQAPAPGPSSLLCMACWLALNPAAWAGPPPQARDTMPAHAQHFTACRTGAEEEAMHRRDVGLLGLAHADQHARARLNQCEVETGKRTVPAKGWAEDPGATIRADKAAAARAHERLGHGAKIRREPIADATTARLAVADLAAMVDVPELTQGRWSAPFVIPVVGVTAVLMHTGEVLFWSYDPVDFHNPSNAKNGVAYLWNPVTRTGRNIPPPENIWCGGQTILADGRIFVSGGNLRYPDPSLPTLGSWQGTLTQYTFNPYNETWARQPDMSRGRWYPTVTQLADNRVVITSGIDETGSNAINNEVEIYTPDSHIDGIGRMEVVGTHNPSGLYPLQFLLPSGNVLEAGPDALSSFTFDPAAKLWDVVPAMTSDHYYLGNGVSFTDASQTPHQQTIMVAGGHDEKRPLANNEWLDGDNPGAGWAPFPLWNRPRHNANTVILPDGSMLTMGGNRGMYGYEQAELSTELYSTDAGNVTGVWQLVAPHAIQAAYHSTAILLPDATVLVSQDDMDFSAAAAFQHKAQVYSPPYLFRGPQPVITSAPDAVRLGQTFAVTTNRPGMASAMLVAPGATTHGNDMHQRAVKLAVVASAQGLQVTLPTSAGVLPPGYYMLFVLDSGGIPSVARFVHIS